MAIADTISSMYENVGEVYDTITNVEVNTGKNLFNKDTITKSSYLKEDGTLLTGTSQEYNTSDFIPVEPNTAYYKTQTLSPRTKFYDANKQALNTSTYQDVSIGGNSGTFTTPNNAHYFRFTINTNPTTGANINSAMVNKGTTALPYEPYTDNPTYKNIENIPKVIRNSYLEIMNNGIDKIWNNWEKVTGSGTDISLSPTLEAPMRNVLNGNTYQFTTTGKNLFNIEGSYETGTGITYTKNDDGSYTLNGTANGNNFLRGVYHLNEQHTLSYKSDTSNSNVILRTRTGTPSAQTGIQDQLFVSSTSGSLTSSKQFDFVEISIVNGTTLNNFKIYIQLEKGGSVTSFEPYTGGQASPNPDYPQDIHVVSGNNTIKVTGKNLAYMKNGTYTYNHNTGVISNNNIMTLNTSGSTGSDSYFSFANGYTTQWAPTPNIQGINDMNLTSNGGDYVATVITNKTMPSAVNIYFWTSKGRNWQRRIDAYTKVVATMSLDEDEHIKDIGIWVAGSSNVFENYTIQVQLEKGNTATDYEPYSSNSYPINLGVENLWKNQLSGFLPQSGSYPTTNSSYPNARYVLVNLIKGQSITLSGISFDGSGRIRYIDKDTNQVVGNMTYLDSAYYTATHSFGDGFYEGTITAKKDFIVGIMDLNGNVNNLIVNYGTTPQTTSDNPIELAKISTYQDKLLRTSGKNLFDKSTIQSGDIRNASPTIRLCSRQNLWLEPGTYTFSTNLSSPFRFGIGVQNVGVPPLDSYPTYIYESFWQTTSPITFTIDSGGYCNINISKIDNGTLSVNDIIDFNYQLEKGSTATDYEPYGSGEWYTHKEFGEVVLNGSESWFAEAQRYRLDNIIQGKTFSTFDENNPLAYCNGFKWGNGVSNNYVYGAFWYTANGLNLSMQKDENPNTTTLANFKTWLESNNQKVYYVLATPNYTKITYEPLLEQLEAFYNAKSKNNQTNITQENNDLPFIIDSTMLKEV